MQKNGTLPLFYQFSTHENYYKLIYDFNVYDCVTEEYAPQEAVTNTYPAMIDGQVRPVDAVAEDIDTTYLQETAEKQMSFMNEYNKTLDEDLDALAENMEEGNYSLFSDRYWYPNMTKAEIAEVKDIAQNEANKTDNYLGIDAKWLYNNQKGHRYFALYRTAREEITLLYACKDDSAELEHNLLKDIIEEDGQNESIDTGSATIDKIFSRAKNASGRKAANRNGTVGAGSNAGNAAIYSGNQGNGPSKAFFSCIQNIKKVQQQYGVDDHYLFAVERGDYATAQRMVDDAAREAGFAHRRQTRNKLNPRNNDAPYYMFVDGLDTDSVQVYGNNVYYAHSNGSTWIGDIRNDILRMMSEYYGEDFVNEQSPENIESSINPPDIVMSAGVWDDIDFVQYMWDNYFESIYWQTDTIPAVKTSDGLIVLGDDMSRIKSAGPVTYDDNGNVIPLSRRFDVQNADIRFQERNADASSRAVLAQALTDTVSNEAEAGRLKAYKAKIEQYNAEEQKLRDMKARLKELSFAKGKRDTEQISSLKAEITKSENRLKIFDSQLLRLESTKALKDLVAREKAAALNKARTKSRAALREAKLETIGAQKDSAIWNTEYRRLLKAYDKAVKGGTASTTAVWSRRSSACLGPYRYITGENAALYK